MFAGDREREQASITLREHYVRGRLTLDEFTSRTARVLNARSREELRRALSGLPQSWLTGEHGWRAQVVVQTVVRGALLVVFTGAYLMFSLALLFVLGLTLLFHGASASVLLAFLVVWLVPTYLLTRLWGRRRPPRSPYLP